MSNLYSYQVKNAKGQLESLQQYQGKVVLIVNVASQCGFTPQYTGLQKLYTDYSSRGFVVLGFPCNQFGFQEPGSDDSIQQFCGLNYQVTFPILAKVDVNGAQAEPLFAWLKSSRPGLLGSELIKWNFTKFLVGRDGQVIDRFAPQKTPEGLRQDIEQALG